ncbi:uncharacterized protein J7T54_005869 [Emericellopsis cladophorae]|uniref:Uncharacterized protein n=1 Tax=Emericellopsis cladophorae TaxID=2686198 RepID=A0A9Q0B8X2_9HYPO|nr:uncharacterized protein J7T54_005869 [Emericellopsis cladophorae]KAI6777577.1 hypothetical protein J7T54_005869 [Emericellopsis cladophorae]
MTGLTATTGPSGAVEDWVDIGRGVASSSMFELSRTVLGLAYQACRNVPRIAPPREGQLRGPYARDPDKFRRLLLEVVKACDEFLRLIGRHIDAPQSTSATQDATKSYTAPSESAASRPAQGEPTDSLASTFADLGITGQRAFARVVSFIEWDVLGFDAQAYAAASQRLDSAITKLCKFHPGFDLEIRKRSVFEARMLTLSPQLRSAVQVLTDMALHNGWGEEPRDAP